MAMGVNGKAIIKLCDTGALLSEKGFPVISGYQSIIIKKNGSSVIKTLSLELKKV